LVYYELTVILFYGICQALEVTKMNRNSLGVVRQILVCLVALAAISLVVPTYIQAGTLTYSASFSSATDWSDTLMLPEFSGSGTLTSAEIDLVGSVSSLLTVGNISGTIPGLTASASTGFASTASTLSVSSGSLAFGLSPLTLLASATFDPLQPGAVVSGLPAVQTAMSSNTYTNPTLLADLTGAGKFSLAASTLTATGITYTGGVSYALASPAPVAALTATVTYTFTAVPEPSTLALLGVGIVALIGYGWRRRSA
jgi:hypothetical protein